MPNRKKDIANTDMTSKILHELLEQISHHESEEKYVYDTSDEIDNMSRTIKIYIHHYTSKILSMQQRRVALNVAIVILAISSVIIANSFCAYPVGHIILIVTTSSVTLAAIITLTFDYPSKSSRYLETIRNYQDLYADLGKLGTRIQLREEFAEIDKEEFTGLAHRAKALILNSPEAIPDRKLIVALVQAVSPDLPIPVKAPSVPRKPEPPKDVSEKSAPGVAKVWPIVRKLLLFVLIGSVILIALIYLFLLIRFRFWHP